MTQETNKNLDKIKIQTVVNDGEFLMTNPLKLAHNSILPTKSENLKSIIAMLGLRAENEGGLLITDSVEFYTDGSMTYEIEKELFDNTGIAIYKYFQDALGEIAILKKNIIEYANTAGEVTHYYSEGGITMSTKINPDGEKETNYFVSYEKKKELLKQRDNDLGTLNVLNAIIDISDKKTKNIFLDKQKKLQNNLKKFESLISKCSSIE